MQAEDFKETCDFCKKEYSYYMTEFAGIPPSGIYSNNQDCFICDKCIKTYFHTNNDVFNILYQNSQRNSNFAKDLFEAVKYFIPNLFKLSRNHIPQKLRDKIFKKYNYKCVDCGSDKNLSIDHIKPYSKGGSDKENNLQVLCKSCNSKKGNKT